MSEDVEVKQANFEGWAIVEMMGHRKEIGYVTTQAFGPAVLFRVDTPELPERTFVLTRPEYLGSTSAWCPTGTKVKRAAVPARSCLVAPGSLYALNPCSEEAARTAIERNIERPLILLELPTPSAIAALPDSSERRFTCCGWNPEDGHMDSCTAEDEDDDEEVDHYREVGL